MGVVRQRDRVHSAGRLASESSSEPQTQLRRRSTAPDRAGVCVVPFIDESHQGTYPAAVRRKQDANGAGRPLIADQVRRWESPQDGGLWLRTVCERCNNLASKYDEAYGDFAEALLPHAGRHRLSLPTRNGVPPIAVAPGRVSRSVLHGMIALSPSMHLMHAEFCDSLREDGDDIRLPAGLRLRIAMTTDRHARIASAYHYHRVLGRRQDYEAFAEIYFRPLVWLLTSSGSAFDSSLPDEEGWGDATDWISYSRECWRTDLRDVLDRLPTTRHPSRRSSHDEWVEFAGPTSYVLEGTVA